MDPSSSLLTIPSILAVPVYVAPEDIAIGRTVFQNFVHEEFEQEHINDADILVEDEAAAAADNPDGLIDANFAFAHNAVFASNFTTGTSSGNAQYQIKKIGRGIRELANEFAHSPQRQHVRRFANTVNLNDMTFENFWDMLEEVFLHEISAHNIIALFYFCADVLKRCVVANLKQIGMNLFKWALKYISEKVVEWVQRNGGWEKAANVVIKNRYFQVCAVVVLCVAFGYLWIKD